jgi:hypothetical protein
LIKATISFVMSVRLPVHTEQLGSHWTDFQEFLYLSIFRNLSRKFEFYQQRTRTSGTLQEDQYNLTFFIISRTVLLRMRNVSDKICRENQNTHFTFNNFFFENRIIYKIMLKNIVKPDRPQMTMWRMRVACWVPKTTNSHSEQVILTAFPLQQWLHEGTSVLRYMYIVFLV